jgi:signal transduction histidine kinase/CheY-like chemotaxis protein
MQGYSYSVFSIVAIAIHLIINFKLLIGRGEVSARGRYYRGFLLGTLAYYITDGAWGILAGLDWTGLLYVDTIFFFLSLVAFVFMWGRFVVAYLDFDRRSAWILSWFGYAILAFNLAALAANFFNKCFFYIDSQGVYQTGHLRDPAFYLLVAFNIFLAFYVFVKGRGGPDIVRRRSMMVILFSVTIAAALVLQIIWPLTPFTALGCLVGNCFLHVFVVADEHAMKHMVELEKALERAHAAEKARSLFFSNVSHDIRTPLNAIIGYTELLIGGIQDEQERSKALSAISTSGHTLLQLINDVLDLSKLESGKMVIKPEPTDVRELVSSVLHSFDVTINDRDVELKEEYGSLPILEIDPQRVRQILFNLIGNSVKFTEHGEIRVRASFRKDLDDAKGVFTLSVSDTGCGIPDKDKDKLMSPFVQAGENAGAKGTGLGLSICKQLAAGMGGQLSFVSELGKGTTFTLELKDVKSAESIPGPDSVTSAGQEFIRTQRDETCTENPIEGQKALEKYHILIVDDVPLNLAVLKALLKKIGEDDVETAVDGQDAWEKLQASGRPFDCVLTDIWMPKMDGKELVSKIRADKRFAEVPVYAITADIEEKKNFSEHKFTGTLLKPLTINTLFRLFK